MSFNRKYIKIDVNDNNPLKNKVPNAHISLVEYYVPNGTINFGGDIGLQNGNWINGRFNSGSVLGVNTLRTRIKNFLNGQTITFEPKSLVKMGTSDWLGAQMKMKKAGNDESFDFLTDYVTEEMWNILNGQGIVNSRQVKRFNRNSFNWIRKIGGINYSVQNDTTWYLEEWVNNLGNPVLYVKIYYPEKPHISIASSDDFKMGVAPGGYTVNGSKLVGGSIGYKPIENNLFKLA